MGQIVRTYARNTVHFEMDKELCGGMPYIDLAADTKVLITIKYYAMLVPIFWKKYDGLTKAKVKEAKQASARQRQKTRLRN